MNRTTMREVVALIVIVGFFVAYFLDPANQIFAGAIVAAFSGAVAYYLGSSKGAHENREALNELAKTGGHSPGSVTVEAPATVSVETSEPKP